MCRGVVSNIQCLSGRSLSHLLGGMGAQNVDSLLLVGQHRAQFVVVCQLGRGNVGRGLGIVVHVVGGDIIPVNGVRVREICYC